MKTIIFDGSKKCNDFLQDKVNKGKIKIECTEIEDNNSVCSNCDIKTNDDTETIFDEDGDPYCLKCFSLLNK